MLHSIVLQSCVYSRVVLIFTAELLIKANNHTLSQPVKLDFIAIQRRSLPSMLFICVNPSNCDQHQGTSVPILRRAWHFGTQDIELSIQLTCLIESPYSVTYSYSTLLNSQIHALYFLVTMITSYSLICSENLLQNKNHLLSDSSDHFYLANVIYPLRVYTI